MKPGLLATSCARISEAKLGEDIVVMDLRGVSPIADYFVIVTASSTVHAQAIARELEEQLSAAGERMHHKEGQENASWILLDYVDVVVHIFLGDVRSYYGLERLWGDVPQVRFAQTDSRRPRHARR